MDVECKWKMQPKHCKGFEYLNDACYLSGSFTLDCPEHVVKNGKTHNKELSTIIDRNYAHKNVKII